jgi:hypothetical protein
MLKQLQQAVLLTGSMVPSRPSVLLLALQQLPGSRHHRHWPCLLRLAHSQGQQRHHPQQEQELALSPLAVPGQPAHRAGL